MKSTEKRREYAKKYYASHREKNNSRDRVYYARHREEILAYQRKYYAKYHPPPKLKPSTYLPEMIKLREEQGLTFQQLAERFGTTKQNIWELFRKRGLDTSRKSKKKHQTWKEVYELIRKNSRLPDEMIDDW